MESVIRFTVLAGLLVVQINAIIPVPCANEESLTTGECCPVPKNLDGDPGPCGINLGRGRCAAITHLRFSRYEKDVRRDWPIQYFNSTCVCEERYGGFDCGECSFAYNDGTTECKTKTIIPRKSVSDLSDDEWAKYRFALRTIKHDISRYFVANETYPVPDYYYYYYDNNSSSTVREDNAWYVLDSLVNVSTYNLFVWLHHFVAKDNEATLESYSFTDFAHEGTGFPTWHRLFLLWLEREIQVAINDHKFRLPFWDWSDASQREYLFNKTRLGENIGGEVIDDGYLFENWTTLCWSRAHPKSEEFRQICDPTKDSNRTLRRCPKPDSCKRNNTNWPSEDDIKLALSIKLYDAPPYNRYVRQTKTSFRNFMEGFIVGCNRESDNLCSGDRRAVTRKLHNTVHIILGAGDVKNPEKDDPGVMSCVAASPNDPIFINHHANIDCILEDWLWENEADYPTDSNIRQGHRKYDYIVPFIPLYTHDDMFKTADNFGYRCSALSVHAQVFILLIPILSAIMHMI